MDKKNLPVIVVAVIVSLALLGGVYILSTDRGTPSAEKPEQPGSPMPPSEKPSAESATFFQGRLVVLGVAKVGQPIEGFDASMLIMAFPGLLVSDFHMVETFEGHYEMKGGLFDFVRDQQNMISSAEATLSDKGFSTLLANVSARLGMPATTHAEVDAIIARLNTSETFEAQIGDHGGSAMGVLITPLEVLEDSRCPVDVTCIWAGTVRLRADLVIGDKTSEQTFTLGQAVVADGVSVTLERVEPEANSKVKIRASDYRFFFKVTK